MPTDYEWFDDPDRELDDREYPDEDEFDDDSDGEATETVPCPQCGAEVYEDAVACPICGAYITADTNIWSGRPLWWVILALLGLVATIAALVTF